MKRTARLTLVQADWEADDPAQTLAHVEQAVAAHHASDLIAFPELAVHGHELTTAGPSHLAAALRAVGPQDIERFHETVRQHDARVVYGHLSRRNGLIQNVATYVDAHQVVDYAKTHVHWSEDFVPGDAFPVVESPLGPIGMLICYDAAFPEVSRILALRGAKVIVNLSAIPESFELRHVHRRVVACSVFNQVHTVFVNRTGHGHAGGSCVVDPRGEVLAMADPDQKVFHVEIDTAAADDWRGVEPILPHRRPSLYAALSEPDIAQRR